MLVLGYEALLPLELAESSAKVAFALSESYVCDLLISSVGDVAGGTGDILGVSEIGGGRFALSSSTNY